MNLKYTLFLPFIFVSLSSCSGIHDPIYQRYGKLLINEVCSSAVHCFLDSTNEANDFIELYNDTNDSINLENYVLYKKSELNNPYIFPAFDIAPHSYLVISCSGRKEKVVNNQLHCQFTLSQPNGEILYLLNSENKPIDFFSFKGLRDDISFGVKNGETTMLHPTPGFENNECYIEKEILKAPQFSHKSGVYNEEFNLKIESPNHHKIVYTLDSSDPTFNSDVYTNQIKIKDISSQPNVLSARTDISATNIPKLQTSPVSKCVVVKAMSVDDNGNYSPITTASYWVGQKHFINDYELISISTNFDNLFGFEKGIYCNGKIFDDYLNSSDYDPSTPYYYMPGNFTQSGIDWERVASLQYISNSNYVLCNQRVGIRIHGNTSRRLSKKGFNIFSRYTYDYNNHFSYDFNGLRCKAFSLRSGGNNPNFPLTDVFHSAIAKHFNLNAEAQQENGVYLYLNGEFWGLYFITDKYDKTYLEEKYLVDDVVIIKNGLVEEGHFEDSVYFNNYFSFSKKTFTDDVYSEFCNLVNIDSFIDYFLFELYISNTDWTFWNNNEWWIARDNGKIKFMFFDLDFDGGYNQTPEFNPIMSKYEAGTKMLFLVAKNLEFRQKLFNRMDSLFSKLSSDECTQLIDSLFEKYIPGVNESYYRWNNIYNSNLTYKHDSMIHFFKERAVYAKKQIIDKINELY